MCHQSMRSSTGKMVPGTEACLAAARFLVALRERQCIAHARLTIRASKLQLVVPVHCVLLLREMPVVALQVARPHSPSGGVEMNKKPSCRYLKLRYCLPSVLDPS